MQNKGRPWELVIAGLVALISALYFGLLAFRIFPPEQQFLKYPQAAAQLLAGTLAHERLLDFSPLYLQLHLVQARLFPDSRFLVPLVQSAAAASASTLLYLLLRRHFGRLLGIAGVAAFVLNRSLASHVCIFEPEVMLLLFLLCFLWAIEKDGDLWSAGAGGALALCLLTRPNLTPLLAIVPVCIRLRSGARAWRRPVMAFLVFPVLAIVLLAIRNHSVTGVYSPMVMNPGFVFFEGNNPLSSGQSAVYPPLIAELRDEFVEEPDNPHMTYRLVSQRGSGEPLSTAAANRYWASLAVNYIVDHPWRWLRLEGYKVYSLWHEFRRYDLLPAFSFNQTLQTRSVPDFPFALLSALALFGMVSAFREWRRYLVYFALFGIQAASMLVFYVSDRQRAALLPLFVIFACIGATRLLTLPSRTRLYAGAAVAAGAILFSLPADRMRDDLYLWECDQQSFQYRVQGVRLRDAGYLDLAGRSAASAFAMATWYEDNSRPARVPLPGGLAANAAKLWPELARSGASADFDRGVLLLAAGDLAAAERTFAALLAAGRSFDRGFLQSSLPEYYLGLVALRRGSSGEARQWFDRALERSPGDPFTLAQLAALTGEERYRDALQRYFGRIESDWLEGRALLEQGQAMNARTRLAGFSQEMPELRRGMIYLAAASGASGDAVTGADIYMQATGDRADPVMLEGQILKLFADLVRIQPEKAESHYRYGVVLGQFGHFREGVAEIERALALAPSAEFARARDELKSCIH